MILKRVKVNTPLGHPTNCYIVFDEDTKETMVIDPGGEPEKIIEMLNVLGGKLKYIYLTHCHGDHIAGVEKLKQECGGKILIHRSDAEGLENEDISLTAYIGLSNIELETDSRVDDEDLIHVGKIKFKVMHTPGHTQGGTCLYCEEEKLIFSGDTIFKGTWGRTDLPTGSLINIMNSITKKILLLPDETIIYPGHRRNDNNKTRKTNISAIITENRIKNLIYCKIYVNVVLYM